MNIPTFSCQAISVHLHIEKYLIYLKKFIVIFFLFASGLLFSQTGQPSKNYQTTKTTLAAHIGYQYYAFHGVELGFAHARYSKQGGIGYVRAYAFAGELIFNPDSVMAFAPKASFWLTGGAYFLSMGASASYYINKSSSSFRIRPEIGFGLKRFRLVYGYNFALTGNDFVPVNTPHIVTFSALIDFKVLKRNQLGTDKGSKWKRKDGANK